MSCVPVQQSLRHLQTAFVNFWKNGAQYPTFKKKENRQSVEFTRSGFQWENGQLTGEDRQAEDSLVAELCGRSHHGTR